MGSCRLKECTNLRCKVEEIMQVLNVQCEFTGALRCEGEMHGERAVIEGINVLSLTEKIFDAEKLRSRLQRTMRHMGDRLHNIIFSEMNLGIQRKGTQIIFTC